jgi:hypothetical protein
MLCSGSLGIKNTFNPGLKPGATNMSPLRGLIYWKLSDFTYEDRSLFELVVTFVPNAAIVIQVPIMDHFMLLFDEPNGL